MQFNLTESTTKRLYSLIGDNPGLNWLDKFYRAKSRPLTEYRILRGQARYKEIIYWLVLALHIATILGSIIVVKKFLEPPNGWPQFFVIGSLSGISYLAISHSGAWWDMFRAWVDHRWSTQDFVVDVLELAKSCAKSDHLSVDHVSDLVGNGAETKLGIVPAHVSKACTEELISDAAEVIKLEKLGTKPGNKQSRDSVNVTWERYKRLGIIGLNEGVTSIYQLAQQKIADEDRENGEDNESMAT